jgi:deoxyribodipyrimidine photolyase-related protein
MGMALTILDSPLFLNSRAEVAAYFTAGRKRFFQTDFYKQQRQQRGLLLDSAGGPLGGQWSFDADNRQRFPKGKKVVTTVYPSENSYTTEARTYSLTHFPDYPGSLDGPITYPIGFEAARAWLADFLQQRLAEFGVYEDAIVYRENLLNHSLLTPLLNVGLLTPGEVLTQTLAFADCNLIPLNSLEGFVRQITGWREFIHGIYVARGRVARTTNFWGFNKKMPAAFYTATTGILPVDVTIRKVLDTGYCHHIERLMVLGNFMLLCEIDPDEVYRWFMELFIDSYDWVMVPNVYGMSQFADGGLFATKPYLSGSNYLLKMSDYPKGDWQTTWDALFWRFLDKQRAFFLKNPRLSMLVRTFDKFEPAKQQALHAHAEAYLAGLK